MSVALAVAYGWPCVEIPPQPPQVSADPVTEILVTVEEWPNGRPTGYTREGGAWLFTGPLHLEPDVGPMPGAAYDFYWYLPVPTARKKNYAVLAPPTERDEPHRRFGSGCLRLGPGWPLVPFPHIPPAGQVMLTKDPPGCAIWVSLGSWRSECYDYSAHLMLQLLTHPDARVRSHAAIRFGQNGDDYAVDALRASVAHDPNPAVREAAARSLALLGDIAEMLTLKRVAEADTDEDVRRIAEFALDTIASRCGMTKASWDMMLTRQVKEQPQFQFGGFFN
jgi:hypothetical protein